MFNFECFWTLFEYANIPTCRCKTQNRIDPFHVNLNLKLWNGIWKMAKILLEQLLKTALIGNKSELVWKVMRKSNNKNSKTKLLEEAAQ